MLSLFMDEMIIINRIIRRMPELMLLALCGAAQAEAASQGNVRIVEWQWRKPRYGFGYEAQRAQRAGAHDYDYGSGASYKYLKEANDGEDPRKPYLLALMRELLANVDIPSPTRDEKRSMPLIYKYLDTYFGVISPVLPLVLRALQPPIRALRPPQRLTHPRVPLPSIYSMCPMLQPDVTRQYDIASCDVPALQVPEALSGAIPYDRLATDQAPQEDRPLQEVQGQESHQHDLDSE
ncbi:MAG: hypothetical protein LBJ42_01700 [Holosporales bacterium]|jgi:hypothetical protein|nr:hypothetical protein [Holosporales bacterium]